MFGEFVSVNVLRGCKDVAEFQSTRGRHETASHMKFHLLGGERGSERSFNSAALMMSSGKLRNKVTKTTRSTMPIHCKEFMSFVT